MKPKHHSLTIRVVKDLVCYWEKHKKKPTGIDMDKVKNILCSGRNIKDMERWAAEVDEIKDVKVPFSLSSFLIERISNATSFQHFCYCGALGDLKDADVVVQKYDGYCCDCDPFLGWYEEIANMAWADVKYYPDCDEFPVEYLQKSPGAIAISGRADWDDQKYPSALDLAEFYQTGGRRFSADKQTLYYLKALSFGIHMLQDMTVPHHILSTIELGHPIYEGAMLCYWNKFYTKRSNSAKDAQLEKHISPMVLDLLEEHYFNATVFRRIGEVTMELTKNGLVDGHIIPPASKPGALDYTSRAIAATLKAIDLY